ncbi:MAG TPA: protein-L-isoaspartate O-methyltransferase [Steroidobacteraceae bacterium]|nr:protein-L-isoaspartate O-methyltransferase [Steroidobacteraceae bacterium]
MMINVESARQQMVEQQIRAWEVLDARVLATMTDVRRELFTPDGYRDLAFADTAIPIGHGEHMLPPKIDGRILQALELTPQDDVLEVGTGTGFLTACLAHLAGRVQTLEIHPDLADRATANLKFAAVNNVQVEVRDAMTLADEARWDAIAVTGSLPVYDERFQRALRIDGRLFVVVGVAPVMEAWKVTRVGDREWVREGLFETVIDPLVNAPQPPAFVF